MVKRYRKGYRAESRAARELREEGWLVVASRGSHGVFDLWALKIRLIQVKSVDEPQAWTGELDKLAAAIPPAQGVQKELWCWVDREGWEKHVV